MPSPPQNLPLKGFLHLCISKLLIFTWIPLVLIMGLPWRRQWNPTSVLLPGKSNGWRSLVGCSPWGQEESDTTERLHFHFSLSCIGKGNATHSSVPAWRIPGTGEPGGLPSMGSHRIGHDWSNLAAAAWGFPSSSDKEPACIQETWVWSLGQEGPLKKGMDLLY